MYLAKRQGACASDRITAYQRKKRRYLFSYRLSRWLLSLILTFFSTFACIGAWQSRTASVDFNVKTHMWQQTTWLNYVAAIIGTGLCAMLALIASLYLLLLSISATSTEQLWRGYRSDLKQRRRH